MSVSHDIEEWRDVVGYEGRYQVSSHGRIKSTRKLRWKDPGATKIRILKPTMSRELRYLAVCLGKKQKQVHRLVLEAFVGPCPDGMECCHYDGNGRNNHLSNLRWDTHSGNMQDRERHGRAGNRPKGETHHCAKLNPALVLKIRQEYADGKVSYSELGKQYGMSVPGIQAVINRRTWKSVQ